MKKLFPFFFLLSASISSAATFVEILGDTPGSSTKTQAKVTATGGLMTDLSGTTVTLQGFSGSTITLQGITGSSFSVTAMPGVSAANPLYIENAGVTTDGNQFNGSGTTASPLTLEPSSVTLQGNATLFSDLVTRDNNLGVSTGTLLPLAGGTLTGALVGQSSITATAFYGDGSSITGITATDNTKVLKTGDYMSGQLTTSSTMTVQGADFSVGASTLVVTSGKVGIGTTSPNNLLQVAGFINFDDVNSNIFLGEQVGSNNNTGTFNVAVGRTAFLNNIAGEKNVAVGYQSLYNNDAGFNSAVGYQALYTNNIGTNNSAFGQWALYTNDSGLANSALGNLALYSNSNGNYNSAMGYWSLRNNDTGDNNSGIGNQALRYNSSGNNNSAVGNKALFFTVTGSSNTAVGYLAGYGISANSYSNNSLFGASAGYGLSTGSNNILLGLQAGSNLTTGSDNIIIGNNENAPAADTANLLDIGGAIYGNLSNKNVGISTASPSYRLHVSSGAGEANEVLVVSTGTSDIFRVKGTGEVYAGKYYGDGSGLTGVTVSQIAASSITAGEFITGVNIPAAGVLAGSLGTSVIASSIAVGAINNSNQIVDGTIANADLAGSIAYSKLSLTGAVLNADLAGSIEDTKLNTIATAGKVSDSALSANVDLLNANQIISGVKTFSSTATVTGQDALGYSVKLSSGILATGGTITAGLFTGSGAGLTGIIATDSTRVLKAGDAMSGPLTLNNSTLTITGADFSVGASTFVVKAGKAGIGTTAPSSMLTVRDGDIAISTTTGSRGVIFQDGTIQTSSARLYIPMFATQSEATTAIDAPDTVQKTNIGTTPIGFGSSRIARVNNFSTIRLMMRGNNAGGQTGTVTVQVRNITDSTTLVSLTFSDTTVQFREATAAISLTGTKRIQVQIYSSTAGDDPYFGDIAVQLE